MRRLLKALAGAVLVTALAAPVSAQATQQYNDIGYSVNPNGAWTYEIPYRVRHKTDSGSMWMKVGNNVDGGVCVRLIDTRTHHVVAGMINGANGVCWSTSQTGHRKVLSYSTPPSTDFAVQAKKSYPCPWCHDNYWSAVRPTGWFYY